ncbi:MULTISPECIES: WhiB family transcriptional regulator [unclassified Streptomyces]|uniref:WhiB family transcriptional regulator n=1 Tax=unclassified Streptomyces TaxID=2593676 RepID=UPI002966B621|nr:WhiB family transcriptional regulator [Streptomyces sp. SJL17-1]
MRYITTTTGPQPAVRSVSDHSWHARAACYGVKPKEADRLFFHGPRNTRDRRQARQVCAACPVRLDCLNWALENKEDVGMWGGLTPKERAKWRTKLDDRLDYGRVREAVNGRDVHLSSLERKAIISYACARGWRASRLAHVLGVSVDWARDQMREESEAIDDRIRHTVHSAPAPVPTATAREADENAEEPLTSGIHDADNPDAERSGEDIVPVDRRVPEPVLFDELRKAA